MSYARGPGVLHWHSIDTQSMSSPMVTYPATGQTWPTADMAIYVPVLVKQRVVVKQLWFGSSGTAAGNYDLGLYDAAGTALLRQGSTAKGGAGETVWNCTDTPIGPGLYYLALVSSTSTDTFAMMSVWAAPIPAALGVLTQSSALPLPATATFAVNQTLSKVPLVGMFLDTRTT